MTSVFFPITFPRPNLAARDMKLARRVFYSNSMVAATDVERLFIQAVLSRGIMSSKLAHILHEKCVAAVKATDKNVHVPHDDSRQGWENFVKRINNAIDKLDFEFRMLHDENSGTEMYALVNKKGDEIAQLATDYTATEIAFFKAIVEQIMLAPNEAFSISSMAALRELSACKINMTQAQGEVVLSSFVAKGWLISSRRGIYALSTRSLLELLPYLKTNYADDIVECTICMEILTQGVACYTPNCKTRMHFHCFKTYRRRQGTCPACSKEWPRDPKDDPLIPVGERALVGREGRRRTRIRTPEDSEEDAAHEDQPSLESQPTKATKRSGRSARFDDSMDVDEEAGPSQRPATQRPRRSSRR